MIIEIDHIKHTLVRGWNRLTRTLGCWFAEGIGVRLYSTVRRDGMHLKAYALDVTTYMDARGFLTVRPGTTDLSPFMFHDDPSDFAGGGAMGISPCGDPGSVYLHDRIFRRCPIGLYDMDTGRMLGAGNVDSRAYNLSGFAQVPGFEEASDPRVYDGEHRIRAYRVGILHRDDPFVAMDLKALLLDSKLFWRSYGAAILLGPSFKGHGYVGRSWSWTAYLAHLVNDPFGMFMRDVARHVIDPKTGAAQRLQNPDNHHGVGFRGNPHPWALYMGDASSYGSGVEPHRDVFQDFEAYHQVAVFEALGMRVEAVNLAKTVLHHPLRKWIDADTGEGVGHHYADPEQAWIGLGALARIDRQLAIDYATRWPVPRHRDYGGSVGPFPTLAGTVQALQQWQEPGKSRWFLEAVGAPLS